MDEPLDLVTLLASAIERGASDLHLCVGIPPMARLHGSLMPLTESPLAYESCRDLIYGILNESQRARIEENWELDFAVQIEGVGRFRGNAHFNRGMLEAAFRHIPAVIPDLDQLGHRPTIRQLCELESGLVLVTGITGSGKSTTLAAMVQAISQARSGVIISIEDPIEFIFQNSLSIIKQREVGSDTKSFPDALRHVLRQDPDVIMISEMRDRETVQAAITAAETGHLVLSTLHTQDAPKSIDRIVDVFPPDQQAQITAQLANCLQGVVSQRLLPRADGTGRILASETMVMNSAIRACLREHKNEQILGLIEIGGREGMNTIDESVADLYEHGLITKEEALINVRDKARIENLKPKKKGLFG
jgi:twitching motility protein PilT